MALGALIGAYVEDDSGGLRALLPLSGRTLVEYQARCASAAGAAPIIILVERVPKALQDAFERLRMEGVAVFPAGDVQEAVSRFEAGSSILLIGDGVAPPSPLVLQVAEEAEGTIATVPDDEAHQAFERIDDRSRWAGVALIDADLLQSTARMLGDWDLQSTLLRRAIQEGAVRVPVAEGSEPVLAEDTAVLADFQRGLLTGSKAERDDAASRFLLSPIEDFATEQLLGTHVRADLVLWGTVVIGVIATLCILKGWLGAALILLLITLPLDLVALRLAAIRLQPLSRRNLARRSLWPLAGLSLVALGWWEWAHAPGWGAMITALCAAAFAQAAAIERAGASGDWDLWLFSRRNAILLAIPFALLGAWNAYLLALLLYSAVSFFLIQRLRKVMGS